MAEYIEREDAINLFWPVDPENDGSDGCTVVLKCGHYNSNEIEAMLSDLPAANVAEVRHGRWIPEICESISKRNRLIEYLHTVLESEAGARIVGGIALE